MRVFLIHHNDQGLGGGQIAMRRLAAGLQRAGVDARLLCKVTTRNDSIAMPSMPAWEAGFATVARRLGFNDLHAISSFKIRKMEAFLKADVLDFHCIHGGFFNYLALPRLTEDKSAVFTLHDVWPFTGGCGISLDCDRWATGCGKCPHLSLRPGADRLGRDATRLEWHLKNWAYTHSNFTIVAPSHWLVEKARQSMLNRFPIHHIPHGIDTSIYQPHDTELCRSLLGIPPRKHVLLFAASHLTAYLKGGDLLEQALQRLPASLKTDTFMVLLGRDGERFAQAVGIPALSLGYVSNDYLKAICYSAADLFLMPSRSENFPLVILESLACGTPIVSYHVGGIPEVVRPDISGYLAEPENAEDFSNGIVQLLNDRPCRHRMRQQCRDVAVKEYALELQIQRYITVYRQLLNENGRQHAA